MREQIGIDIAIEAPRRLPRTAPLHPDELSEYARVCRVSRVMRPYMEALA